MRFHYTRSLAYFLLLATMLVSITMEDSSKDKEECAEQLAGLSTCLSYVQGEAKAPTPDCCSGLKQVLKSNKKCLCVIIKDRNDPDLSLQINVTLALSLPTVCNAPANVSKCPELLHMDPKSPEAQVFYQSNKTSANGGPSPAPSPNEGASPASGKSGGARTGSQAASTTPRNDACGRGKGFLGLKVLLVGLLVGLFMGSHSLTWALM